MEKLSAIIEKHIGKQALQKVITQNNYNQEYQQELISYLDSMLNDLKEDVYEYDSVEELLKLPIAYINGYIESRNKNYSILWSKKYADITHFSENEYFICDCYKATKEVDKEQAIADLKNYCKLTNRDKLFTELLFQRIDDCFPSYNEDVVESVENFLQIYLAQIAKGKTELYANEYTYLIKEGLNPVYCEDYAYMYEMSLKKGKSETYARVYADKYADELVNVKCRYGISDDEEMLDFAIQKAKAFINAWEYAKDNNLKSSEEFIHRYEHIYLNALYDENPAWSGIEEYEEFVLKMAIEAHDKRIKD